jgi:hypothetical protein
VRKKEITERSVRHGEKVKNGIKKEKRNSGKEKCPANLALRHEGVWAGGRIDPHILDLCTIWR